MKSCSNFFYAKEYQKQWERTHLDLKRIIYAEDDLQKEGEIEEWQKEVKILGPLYVQYAKAINKLDECYEQIVHPQKRILLRKLLDACLCRYLEVKHRMVLLSMDEVQFMDSTCVSEKILPRDADINIPKYLIRDHEFERRKLMTQINSIMYGSEEKDSHDLEVSEDQEVINADQPIKTQDKTSSTSADNLSTERISEDVSQRPRTKRPLDLLKRSATIIQKTYRDYKCRKNLSERKAATMRLIGLVPESYSNSSRIRSDEIKILRHQMQRRYDAKYHQVIPGERVRLMLRKKRKMEALLRNRVRDWYMKNVLLNKGKKSGDASVPQFAILTIENKLKSPRFKPKPPKVQAKPKPKKSKLSEEKPEEVKKNKVDPRPLERPKLQRQLIWISQEFRKKWQDKDESNNFIQIFDVSPITANYFRKMKKEIRKVVDDLMFVELKRLQEAVVAHRGTKKKGKGKKGKKGKGKKGGKKEKKQEVDLTADRSLNSLLEELIAAGIIKNYPEVPLSSFLGERYYCAQKLTEMGKTLQPTLGDVRALIKEYCILPLGSSFIHENSPLVKSVMIAGPHGSGKHKLIHAICTEVRAVLFDITNENIAEKYPDNSSLPMLMHLVNKVSRLLQPSVIFIDNAEKTFIKKVPKNDTSNPRRLKSVLPKFVNGIKENDRIILIGISNCPFNAKQPGLNKVYKKFLYLPKPDYATLYNIWKDTLSYYTNVNGFDCFSMARVCDGFSISVVLKMIEEVMSSKSTETEPNPPQLQEFVNHLVNEPRVYKTEEAKFLKWYQNCPLGKKKKKYLESLEEDPTEKNKKKEKK